MTTTPTLEQLKRTVTQRSKAVDRHYDKMDAIEEWNEKTRYQGTMVFVGARDALISAQIAYIAALEAALEPPATEAPVIQWPDSPPVCSCATFGGNSDDWLCPECGGGRF